MLTCGIIGSGLIPGNNGSTFCRMATCEILRLEKICASTPRPEPCMESIANLNPAFAIKSRSANWQMAWMYLALRSTSSILAAWPFGMALALSSCSIIFMMAGVAEPPNFPLNFTPFQFQGLWLEVITTPPAAPIFFTAYEIAGVGVWSLARNTGTPA